MSSNTLVEENSNLRTELNELQQKFDIVVSMVPRNCDTCRWKRFFADENIYNQHRCVNPNQKEYHKCWELRTEPMRVVHDGEDWT